VSEEKTQTQQEQSQESPSSRANWANWEAQLQARANELLTQRTNALKAEIERLQTNISETKARLLEQAQAAPAEQETAGLLEYVKQWLSEQAARAEADFQSRLEQACAEAAGATREQAEMDFQTRLEQAHREWQAGQPTEEDFQKRLEQACAEASALARRESEIQIEDLREQLEASRKALTLAVSSAQSASSQPANFSAIKTAIEEIESQRTQSDTLTALLSRAAKFAPRVLFFVIKGGEAVGWKARGFENGLNDETAKLLTAPTGQPTLLREAITRLGAATSGPESFGDISAVLGLYASPTPERAVAVPLIIRNKTAAVLYADSGAQSENSINTAAIESLMRVAGLVIELLPYRRGAEPARSHAAPAQSSVAAAAAPAPAPEPRFEPPAVQPESVQAQPAVKQEMEREIGPEVQEVQEEALPRVEPEVESKVEQVAPAAPAFPEMRTTEELPTPAPFAEDVRQAEAQSSQAARIEAEPSAFEAEPEEAAEPSYETPRFTPPPPPPSSPPVYAEHPVVADSTASAPTLPMSAFGAPPVEERREAPSALPFAPPPPPAFTQQTEAPKAAQPVVSVPTPASETEQRAHNDARRFARLLVSEIKLYNAAKVNDGRRNYDLYDRLKDEIDRSRKVYDKRVSPAVAARFDYFYDELVQTLAEGDPAKLGNTCPGPVVLA
jgi:hypothetical protein